MAQGFEVIPDGRSDQTHTSRFVASLPTFEL
jgi:hypothetical protein